MTNEISIKKDKRGLAAWFVFLFFSILMQCMSKISNWSGWVNVYLPFMAIAVSYVTFSKKVSTRLQSYIWAAAAMSNIFVYSCMKKELYPSLMVISTLVILLLIFQDYIVIGIISILSLVMVVVHVFLLGTVSFATDEDLVNFIIRISAMVFSELFLMFFVHRLNKVESSLKLSADEARSAERSKSDFLANMSHEIRTPMNAIVGMCELILRDEISESVREKCFNIQNAGRSLLSIINDILDFSKIESGKAELIETEFNIGSTINDAINMAMTRKGDKKLEIIARIEPSLPKGLIGDEVRIKQIMVNLVTNAVKFTSSGCVVLKVTYSTHDYGINLNFSVKDSGIGITEENLEKLFTSFQQVDTRKNRAVEGTGLGLAISKRLVARMGGFINVSSVYGKGSEFKFVIPLKVSDPQPFIRLKSPETTNVAVFIDLQKYSHPKIEKEYRELIYELGEKFEIGFKLFESLDKLKEGLKNSEYTHCIIAREEYMAGEAFFNKLANDINLLVVQERADAIPLPGNIKCLYKPFYSLSVASVLNNENYIFNLSHHGSDIIRFIAPEAKILIVDDNITNLKVAEGLMKPYNMKIITVMGGMDAIRTLKSQDYDLVFMDHMMPGMDGVEATRFIRKMGGEYYKNLPIIALTANAISGVKEMFLKEGFNDFLPKPIELSMLDRVLKTWLPKERIISTAIDLENETEEDTESAFESTLLDVPKGLVYAGGSKEVYLEVVKVYTQSGWEQKESLNRRFENKDWTNYVIEVHALKSSSMSIGAAELAELAKTLELAGKEENYELICERHEELSCMHAEVLMETNKYLRANGIFIQEEEETEAEEDTQTLRDISAEEFTKKVEQIKNACDNFDGDEMISIACEMCTCSLSGKALKPYFVKVIKLAEDFEYEQAGELALKALSDMINQ